MRVSLLCFPSCADAATHTQMQPQAQVQVQKHMHDAMGLAAAQAQDVGKHHADPFSPQCQPTLPLNQIHEQPQQPLTGEQRAAVCAPCQGHAVWLDGLPAVCLAELGAQVVHHTLALQVPDLDGGLQQKHTPTFARARYVSVLQPKTKQACLVFVLRGSHHTTDVLFGS
jgi:hypothetical protein